jgi:hypothetical protein
MACLGELSKITISYNGVSVVANPTYGTYAAFEITSPSSDFRGGFQSGKEQYGSTFKTFLTKPEFDKLKGISLKSLSDRRNGNNYAISVQDECEYFIESGGSATRSVVAGSLTSNANAVSYLGIFQSSIAVKGTKVGFDTELDQSVYETEITILELAPQTVTIGDVTFQPIDFSATRVELVGFTDIEQRAITQAGRKVRYEFAIKAQLNSARLAILRDLSNKIRSASDPINFRTVSTLTTNYSPDGTYNVYFTVSADQEVALDLYNVSIKAVQAFTLYDVEIGNLRIYATKVTNSRIYPAEFSAKTLIALDRLDFGYRRQATVAAIMQTTQLNALQVISESQTTYLGGVDDGLAWSGNVFVRISNATYIDKDLYSVTIEVLESVAAKTVIIGGLTLYPTAVISSRIDPAEFSSKTLIALDQLDFNYRYSVAIESLVNVDGLAALKAASTALVTTFTNNFEDSGFTGGECFVKYTHSYVDENLYKVSIEVLQSIALRDVFIDTLRLFPTEVISSFIDPVSYSAKTAIAIKEYELIRFPKQQTAIKSLTNTDGLNFLRNLSKGALTTLANNFEPTGFAGDCFIKFNYNELEPNLYSVDINLLEVQPLKRVQIGTNFVLAPNVQVSEFSQTASDIGFSVVLQPLLTGPIARPKRQFAINGICSGADAIYFEGLIAQLEIDRLASPATAFVPIVIDSPLFNGDGLSFNAWLKPPTMAPTEEYEIFTFSIVAIEI